MIRTGIWSDADMDGWTADAFLLYIYLGCNDHDNGLTGVYQTSDRTIRLETRLSPARLEKAWKHVSAKVERFPDGWIWIRGRGKNIQSADQIKGAQSYLATVPTPVRERFCVKYPNICPPSENPPEEGAQEDPSDTPPTPQGGDHPVDVNSNSNSNRKQIRNDVGDFSSPSSHQISQEASTVVESWNVMATKAGLPTVRALTPKRKRILRQRLHNPAWRRDWRAALERIPKCPFLCGENDRGWRANFEFFTRPDTVVSILEGKYDGAPPKPGSGIHVAD